MAVTKYMEVLPTPDELVYFWYGGANCKNWFTGEPCNGMIISRWPDGFLDVYDESGFADVAANLQTALDRWNAVIGGPVVLRKSDNPNSPIRIIRNPNAITCGVGPITNVGEGVYLGARIEFREDCVHNLSILIHELGHVLGFTMHTSDGGVMDTSTVSDRITPQVWFTIHRTYELPPRTFLPAPEKFW